MLYRPVKLDFSEQVMVFIHIPKTAGTSLTETLLCHLGRDDCIATAPEKLSKIHSTWIHKTHWASKQWLRKFTIESTGRHALLPRKYLKNELESAKLFHGHFSLGAEPHTTKEPIYVTLIRDPVDRFISEYYYRLDLRAEWPHGARDRRAYWTYDIERYVDFVYARRRWTETNVQCRHVGGEGQFEAARRAIDREVFLAAPSERIEEFVQLLGPVLSMEPTPPPRVNVGRARRTEPCPSPSALAKIRAMVAEDQRLYDYVAMEFDACVAKVFPAPIKAVCKRGSEASAGAES